MFSECFICNITAIAAVILGAIYLFYKYSYTYWTRLDVPYVEPNIPYGNFADSIKLKSNLGESLAHFYTIMKAKGHKHMGLYFFFKPFYMPICPNLIKNIMAKDFQYFHDRGVYHNEENDPLSAHLLSLNGQKWKNLRAKLTPTFTSGNLRKMFHTLVDCSHELSDCLNIPIKTGEPVDINSVLVKYTTDVIGSCAFGIECNSFKQSNTDFIRLGKQVFRPNTIDRMKQFIAFLFPSIAELFKMRITNKNIDMFFRNLVKDNIEYREKHNITRNDFMQLLIQLKNEGTVDDDEHIHNDDKPKKFLGTHLTLNEIAAQAFLFFIAGFETSSTTMTFALFELAQNPEVQHKLRNEIMEVLKKHDGKITYDAVTEMHYMDRVVQETLRKYPPVFILQRVVTKNYKIPDTDIVLEKGSTVLIPVLALHKDPEFYPDPERFDPERFTKDIKFTRPDYTYIPFGEGPRICIGSRFGMMQAKVGLCQLLQNYKFTLNQKTKLPLNFEPNSFIACAEGGIWLNAENVNYQ